jgi:hypothetical protein
VVRPFAPRLGFGLPASLRVLQALIVQIDVLTDQITEQLHAHADAHIFRSLPRAQALWAAQLLAFRSPGLNSACGRSGSQARHRRFRRIGLHPCVDRGRAGDGSGRAAA